MKLFTKSGAPTSKCHELVRKLNTTGGWHARQDLTDLTEKACTSFGAATGYEQEKNWSMMLWEIEEGITEAKALRKALRCHLAAANKKHKSDR